jgi:hypothetical protein
MKNLGKERKSCQKERYFGVDLNQTPQEQRERYRDTILFDGAFVFVNIFIA